MMRTLKILFIMIILTSCAEKKEVEIQPDPGPSLIGFCQNSLELGCRACLYEWRNRYLIMCLNPR